MKTNFLFALLVTSTSAIAQQTWQWGYEAGGAGNDVGLSISTDPSGFSYVTGHFHSTATFGTNSITSAGGDDIFIAKYASNGSCLWAKRYGSPASDIGYGIDIDTLGNCYVAGSAGSSIFVGKYDTNGNQVWVDTVHSQSNNTARSISTDAAGNSWITGYLGGGSVTFGTHTISGAGGYVVKYDPNGNAVFATKFGASGAIDLYGVTNDPAGNSYVTGYLQGSETVASQTYTSHGNRDMVVIKTDTAGNFLWLNQTSASAGAEAWADGICSDGQNGIYVCGYVDANTIFGGDTLHVSNSFMPREIYVVKYDTSGTELWLQQSTQQNLTASGQLEALSVTADQNANVYITGVFSDGIYFGNTLLPNNSTGMNTYIAMFEPTAGSCQFVIASTGQNPGAFGYGISTDDLGGTYIVGLDKAPVVFGAYTTQFIGGEDMFIAKIMAGKQTGIEEYASANSASLYNTTENFHLSIPGFSMTKKTTFSLYDGMGQLVLQKQIEAGETDIETENLARGIYYWRLEGDKNASGKILK